MSSRPGYTLESYVEWDLNLIVEGHDETNISLGLAETLGTIERRPHLAPDEFAPVLALFEPYRERVEYLLGEFDDESQSWRAYSAVFDFIPNSVFDEARAILAKQSGQSS